MKLKNKTALITGAGGGIGGEIARLFAEQGAEIFICDILDKEAGKLEEEIREKGGKAFFIKLDVADEGSWQAALHTIERLSGEINILVNNAGINRRVPIEEMKVEDWDAMMAVNVRGVFLGIKHVIPMMKRAGGGSIINMSSICGLVGHRYTNVAYTASKGAVTLLTKGVATRYAKNNIRVNSLHPSTADTPLMRELFKDPEKKKERLEEVPLGRLASLRDIAEAALFLASDESSFITGIALPVDGGLTAY
ncbi:MAG: glucose 1-dehydrogenase [Spirochaeta sp.]|nr:glucose 1-dehydrogenase [Spirochaeta sp.]